MFSFHPDYGLLLELQVVTLVARSYALLVRVRVQVRVRVRVRVKSLSVLKTVVILAK